MELRNVKTFIKIAELGNFSKAAEALGYAASTITTQIQQLEKELGYPLFEHIGRRTDLTEPGKKFLYLASAMASITDQMENITTKPGDLTGILRIGVLESLLFDTMLNILPLYHKQYPNVRISLKIGRATELYQLLYQNDLDMLYISNLKNTDSNLSVAYEKQETLVFLAHLSNRLAEQKVVTLKEVLKQPLILTERSGICYRILTECAAAQDLHFEPYLEIDNTGAIIRLVQQNMGVAFLPLYSVKPHLNTGKLSVLDVKKCQPFYYRQILYHKGKWINQAMENMINTIKNDVILNSESQHK